MYGTTSDAPTLSTTRSNGWNDGWNNGNTEIVNNNTEIVNNTYISAWVLAKMGKANDYRAWHACLDIPGPNMRPARYSTFSQPRSER